MADSLIVKCDSKENDKPSTDAVVEGLPFWLPIGPTDGSLA